MGPLDPTRAHSSRCRHPAHPPMMRVTAAASRTNTLHACPAAPPRPNPKTRVARRLCALAGRARLKRVEFMNDPCWSRLPHRCPHTPARRQQAKEAWGNESPCPTPPNARATRAVTASLTQSQGMAMKWRTRARTHMKTTTRHVAQRSTAATLASRWAERRQRETPARPKGISVQGREVSGRLVETTCHRPTTGPQTTAAAHTRGGTHDGRHDADADDDGRQSRRPGALSVGEGVGASMSRDRARTRKHGGKHAPTHDRQQRGLWARGMRAGRAPAPAPHHPATTRNGGKRGDQCYSRVRAPCSGGAGEKLRRAAAGVGASETRQTQGVGGRET